ncbi:adenylosuccinate synthase [bacterium]|nr:adenylosuccinate synthase [bacterium]
MKKVPNRLVVGLFWGDEGKAKIVDLLTENAYVVARYQGGANAGHSVEFANKRFILHQIPTGILHPDVECVLGAGMVLDLPQLVDEISMLEKNGIDWRNRIRISPRAHLVLPYHKQIEQVQESSQGIGTTKRGIGPAYRDKAARIGMRIGDIAVGGATTASKNHLIKKLDNWLKIVGKSYNIEFQSPSIVADELLESFDYIGKSVGEVSSFLDEIARTKGGILAEGAQGTMLSVNWGTYPYVTSSETGAGGASEGLGIDIRLFDEIVGIAKAFCTRVGNGPFPTEGDETVQEILRGTGEHSFDEFGSTTGRPRRCGWFDGMVLKYSARIDGIDSIALTKLDVLKNIDPLKIAVKYKNNEHFPANADDVEKIVPVYENLDGWDDNISEIREYEVLPENAKKYIEKIENISNVPVKYIGVGPARKQIIIR